MKRPRSKAVIAALLACASAVAVAQDSPESLLPPGFNDPVPTPAPSPGGARPPAELLPPALAPSGEEGASLDPDATEEEGGEEEEAAEDAPLELPDFARRSIAAVGPYEGGNGLGFDAWGSASGTFLTGLAQRVDAPVASRWASMLLRRALLTRVPTPAGADPADWVAERAWLLLRMGEADAARMLVQAVDVDRFNRRLFVIAGQTALATADPAALCPLARPAQAFSKEAIWRLSDAVCAGLAGEPAVSGAIIERVRQARAADPIDVLLAEKVVGATATGRRAVKIEWERVERLTSWRFGMATATGLAVPDRLYDRLGPHVRAWQARAPMLPLGERLAAGRTAAALGVFSAANLVDMQSAFADETDPAEIAGTDAALLRTCYAGDDDDARVAAMRELWERGKAERDRYAYAIMTSRAAARIAPSADFDDEAAGLIGAMLSAGLDRQAARWAGVVNGMGAADGDAAWAMLAVGAPGRAVDTGEGRVSDFVDRADAHKARLLVAALAGLGRLPVNQANGLIEPFSLTAQDKWTRLIDEVAARGQRGTVALLVAAAMQTPDWRGVPSRHFYHMIRALRRVGLEAEARMIAAEAMTRL
jgi:hypothetical protein